MGNFSNDKFNVTGRFINDLTIMVVNSTIVTYEDMNEYCLQVTDKFGALFFVGTFLMVHFSLKVESFMVFR